MPDTNTRSLTAATADRPGRRDRRAPPTGDAESQRAVESRRAADRHPYQANFSIIATDENGIIQLFNVGAERMLGRRHY